MFQIKTMSEILEYFSAWKYFILPLLQGVSQCRSYLFKLKKSTFFRQQNKIIQRNTTTSQKITYVLPIDMYSQKHRIGAIATIQYGDPFSDNLKISNEKGDYFITGNYEYAAS